MEQPELNLDETNCIEMSCINEQNKIENENNLIQSSEKLKNDGSEFGKFKDVKSLLDAYNNLQSEFTRKCQKLAEITKLQNTQNVTQKNENNLEMFKINENIEQNIVDLGDKGVPSQNKENVVVSENKSAINFDKQVKNFFAENNDAKEFSERMGEILLENPDLRKLDNAVDVAFKLAKGESLKAPKDLVKDDNFLNDYVLNSPEVTQKIIDKMLDKAQSIEAPKVISSTFGSSVSFSDIKLQNLEDAKNYILKKLQN